jgi:hypothetical protein
MASSLMAIALFFGVGSAQAALVNFTLSGVVDSAVADNVYGLKVADTVNVVGTFDDSVLSGGIDDVLFDKYYSSHSFTLTAGSSYTFTNADDIFYAKGGFPKLWLNAGKFYGFDFVADDGYGGRFDSLDMGFKGYYIDDTDPDNPLYVDKMSGSWTSFKTTPVPVPAAAWLFGSGLLGLVCVARRKVTA